MSTDSIRTPAPVRLVADGGRAASALGRWMKAASFAVAMLAGIAGSTVQAAPVGSAIDNTATATFATTAQPAAGVSSNVVHAVVPTAVAVTITPNTVSLGSNDGPFTIPLRITNTGNVATSDLLDVATRANGLALQGVTVVLDANGNGVVDASDPILTPTTRIDLAPGASVTVLLIGVVPAGTTPSATAGLVVTVRAPDQTPLATAAVTIVAQGPAAVAVTNAVSNSTLTQGDTLVFAVTGRARDTPLAGTPVTVDGDVESLVLLRSPISVGTGFITATPPAGASVLYHYRGEPDTAFHRAFGLRLNVDVVAFGVPTLAAGQTLAGSVLSFVKPVYGGNVTNTATLTFADQGAARSVASNTIELPLPALQPSIGIYSTKNYLFPIPSFAVGTLLYVQFIAPACAGDPTKLVSYAVRLDAKLSRDSELITVTETAPGSGVFLSDRPVKTVSAVTGDTTHADGFLAVMPDDRVTATTISCAAGTFTSALVDPAGIVFDTTSNQPIVGAVVTLIDVLGNGNGGKPGQAAIVTDYDGQTQAPSTVTTGTDGRFTFPLVPPSTYRLIVTPPSGYVGPSHVAPGALPAGHIIDTSGSYGGNFVVSTVIVLLDYPLDPVPLAGLFVEKTASKSIAEIGDFVDYSVTVKNTATVPMANIVLHDRLPRGFSFQKGTVRINGVRVADPVGATTLDFALGTTIPSQQSVVTYRLKIGPGAQGGDGINRANATAGLSQSNTASAKVLLSDGGVFSDRAYLIGKVFADCNGNGIQDTGERGIPDVRVVLEDGTSATTDEDGKYSLYGLLPRTHVAKVDATTMVAGTTLEAIDSRNAGDGNSRFVDLKNGELHRADFAVVGCGPTLDAAITARRARASRVSETDTAVKALLSTTPSTAVDARTLPSSGTIDATGIASRGSIANGTNAGTNAGPNGPIAADALPSTSDISDVNDPASKSRLGASVQSGNAVTPAVVGPIARASLTDLLPTLAPGLGFVDLQDDAIMPSTQATIRVKGPSNVRWSLVVNGKTIGDSQVGERSVLASRNLAAVEYVGVALAPGTNQLELVAQDDFGNARERAAITVKTAGRLARIAVDVPAEIKADGRSIVPLHLRLLDANGLPVAGRIGVTLDTTAGKLLAKDLDPREPGTQVLVDGGTLDIDLQAPVDAGKGTLRAVSGTLSIDVPLVFVPDLRPLLAVGLVEGVFNLRSLGANSIVGAQTGDAFEREIQNVSRQWDNGKMSAEARGALYLKGKVLGSTLLTVAYDSDKPARERLFRDIQPDQFYPVYGDSSVKSFDAQSTSRLYVRVDQGQSYVLYGDFTTQTDDPARSLTQYNRSLTGAKGRLEAGPVRVDGFASYTSSQQVVDELRGNGTSGPFTLSRANGVVNSEQVHILTRDRNQPSIVIKDVPMTRFADYEMEPYTGNILFKLPIPSVDADLNPISIRITYEVDDGGRKFWVGGVDAKVAVTDQASVGGVFIRDTDPSNRSTLRGVNGTYRFAEHAVLVGEFAETDSDLYGLGKGRRVEYKQDDENFQARVYAGKTDVTFVNPNALLSQGRTEYGGKVGLRLSEQDRLTLEGIRSEDPLSGGRRTGVLARVERTYANNVKVEIGLRHVDESVAPADAASLGVAPNDFTSLRAKVTVPVPFVKDASAFAEYERALGAGDRQVAALGGSYQLPQGGKLYIRHEFISSLQGAYDLNSTQRLTTTVIGIDSDYMKDGHVFNEYRVGGGIDARSAEAAIGLRNLWRIADGVNVTTTAENVKPIGGPIDDRSTAVTAAIDYTANPDWKGSARAEYRNGNVSDSRLLTTGAAYKWNDATTLLGKAIYSDLTNAATASGAEGGAHRIARAQFGAAYRPVDTNVWNALGRIEFKREQDSTIADTPLDETAIIGSAHLNVSPSPDLSFNARYGVKRATDRAYGIVSHATTQLLGGRMIKDITDKWDVGANAFVLATDGIRNRTFALGAEAGYRVATNLWISAGYNVSGFKDKDLAGDEYTQRGAYLRMRYKFDESLFGSPANGGTP